MCPKILTLALRCLLGTLFCAVGAAQEILLQVENDGPLTHSFNRIGGYADITGDGVPELLVGLVGVERMRVVSGTDGAVVHEVSGYSNTFGQSFTAVGDFDQDGVPDFAVGEWGYANNRGRVLVYSGVTGQVLAEILGPTQSSLYGWSLGAMGDVDGDGYAAIALGGFYGDVHVHRGPDGGTLQD